MWTLQPFRTGASGLEYFPRIAHPLEEEQNSKSGGV
jgi:hypothetical protein